MGIFTTGICPVTRDELVSDLNLLWFELGMHQYCYLPMPSIWVSTCTRLNVPIPPLILALLVRGSYFSDHSLITCHLASLSVRKWGGGCAMICCLVFQLVISSSDAATQHHEYQLKDTALNTDKPVSVRHMCEPKTEPLSWSSRLQARDSSIHIIHVKKWHECSEQYCPTLENKKI